MLTGRCLCGGVRLTLKGALSTPTACHCGMCRRWHGALGVYAGISRADCRIESEDRIRCYASSPKAERGFCRDCGSKLFWRRRGGESLDIAMGVIDPPTGLAVDRHIWVAHKGDYYDIADGLPQYAESSRAGVAPMPPAAALSAPTPLADHRGHCLCGAVDFRIAGPMRDILVCHCRQCLRWHGHVAGYSSAPWAAVTFARREGLRWYQSSAGARRGFCGDCGASLFWEPMGENRVSIAAGALEAPTGLREIQHIYVADKSDYYRIADGLPQVAGSSR